MGLFKEAKYRDVIIERIAGTYSKAIEKDSPKCHAKGYSNRGMIYMLLGDESNGCGDLKVACAVGNCTNLSVAKADGKCQ